MITLALILALFGAVILIAGAAGRLVRLPEPMCTQDCSQGRDCGCGTVEQQS